LKIEWKKQRALRPSKVVVGTIKCDYCDEMLVTESKKVHHMLSAHKEYTPYECSYCHKRYKNKLCWREHESTHVGETNFLCNICGKVSKTRTLLRTHLRTHQVCNLLFFNLFSSLKKDLNIHFIILLITFGKKFFTLYLFATFFIYNLIFHYLLHVT